jgi:hypothetical protein
MQVSATTSGQKFSIKVHLPKNIYYIAYVDQMDRGSTSITSGSSVTGGVGAGVAIAEAADASPSCRRFHDTFRTMPSPTDP